MTEVMIDIETLDNKPSSVVLSIGAVTFTQENGAVGDSFYQVLEFQSQIEHGRTISEGTLLWWASQDWSAFAEAFKSSKDRQPPGEALLNLHYFVSDAKRIWANSPSFDAVILDSLCNDFGRPALWRYRDLRDLRTITDLVDRETFVPTGSTFPAHHPLGDCHRQIQWLVMARNKLGLK